MGVFFAVFNSIRVFGDTCEKKKMQGHASFFQYTGKMKLYKTLESQLKKEPNYVSDNGELKKWVVINKAQNFDEELIALLYPPEQLHL